MAMTKKEREAVYILNGFKQKAAELGYRGVSDTAFRTWYGENRIGFDFNKDGHCAEVVCAYMCGLVGANVEIDAKADFRGVDLVINGIPVQIKYDWEEGSWDAKYEGRTWWIDGYKEPIVVVYPSRKDNGIDALSKLTQSDAYKMRLSAKISRAIVKIWFWFSHNTEVKKIRK